GLSANDSLAQLTMSSDGVLVLFPSGTRPGICTNAEESASSINYTASTTAPKQFERQSPNTGAGRVNMFGKSNGNASDTNRESPSALKVKRPTVGHSTASEAASCISSGLSIVGKIVGQGTLSILGHVEGEVHASTVQIGDGAQVVGNIVSEELTIGGCV